MSEVNEFSVTLCAAEQAGLADFVGSFSGREIDKMSSERLTLAAPVRIDTPWVAGGTVGLECTVRERVELPHYLMVIGKVIAEHIDEASVAAPLVKRGSMYTLGLPVSRDEVVAAAELVTSNPPILRVAATGPVEQPDTPWSITLLSADGRSWPLGQYSSNEYGDLFVDTDSTQLDHVNVSAMSRVLVERTGLKPGLASISRVNLPQD